ncbi:MAG TPA: response regulator [Burkholderiales bacterium]|nr:response regulator [Burkholderiales bacterium]
MKTRPCIAIVDDEPRVCTAIGRLLQLAEYEVRLFGSGGAFLKSLEGELPDCAVLDVHMPGMSGLEVEASLLRGNLDIPVVFITASDDLQLRRRILASGNRPLLTKPFSNNQLLSAIGAAMQRARGPLHDGTTFH